MPRKWNPQSWHLANLSDLSPGSVDNSVGNAAMISLKTAPIRAFLQFAESLCSSEATEIKGYFLNV